MSKIDEIIAEKCPDGVSYYHLTDVAHYVRGITYSKKDEQVEGPTRVLRANNITLSSNTLNLDDIKLVSEEVRVRDDQRLLAGDILICAGSGSKEHIGKVAFISEDRTETFGGFMAVVRAHSKVDPRFLFHVLTGETFLSYLRSTLSSTTINNLNARVMQGFRLPVPPLEVQCEIVKILDTFTALEAELEAELEARTQQYEHYSRCLLEDNLEVEQLTFATVDELCAINRGKVISKDYLAKNPGPYPVYSSQTANEGIFGFIDTYAFDDEESITWTTDGANAGSVFYHKDKKFNITNVCGRLVVKDERITHRYLYFQLRQRAKRFVHAGMGNPKLMANHMGAIPVPVPPLDEQHRVVEILDKFDALVNDLSIGLPAEITARRQQYEHYRDKLLTFQEVEGSA